MSIASRMTPEEVAQIEGRLADRSVLKPQETERRYDSVDLELCSLAERLGRVERLIDVLTTRLVTAERQLRNFGWSDSDLLKLADKLEEGEQPR